MGDNPTNDDKGMANKSFRGHHSSTLDTNSKTGGHDLYNGNLLVIGLICITIICLIITPITPDR